MDRAARLALLALLVLPFGCTVASGDAATEYVDDEPNPSEVERSAEALTLADGLDAEELAFFRKINEYRAVNGLAALQVSVALTKAADYHSVDMATKNYFSHTSQDGTSFGDRVKRYYSYNTYYAENIAAGNAAGLTTFDQWKNSAGHNANMLSTNYKVIGIARAYSGTSTYKWYWTTDFGGYVDEVMTDGATPPPPPASTNLITDGGFETTTITTGVGYASVRTLNKWHAKWSTGGAVAPTTGAFASGARSLRVVDPNPGSVTATQLVAATAGKTYKLSAKAKRPSGNSRQSIWVDFLDASYNNLGRFRAYATSYNTWATVSTTGAAPANTKYARVVIYGSSTDTYASTYHWDNVSLVAQ
jgi:uncharacterized protein YkwD